MKTWLNLFFLVAVIPLFAQEKTFEREYTYKASDLDSKISCRTIAVNQLRSILLNEIGVYVESESILKTSDVGGTFSQDFVENIATITAGVTKLQILDETWNGETFWMKASITIDRKSLEESLKQLVNDRQKVRELESLKMQLLAATKELDILKKRASTEIAKDNASGNQELNNLYNSEVETLDATSYVLSGYDRFYREDFKGAIGDFNRAIEIDPKNASAFIGRGFSKFKLHDYKGEIADYTRAIEIDPGNANTYYNRGVAKDGLGDYQGVIADCTKAIEIDPKHASAYYNRGVQKARLGNDKAAIMDYNKAIENDPSLAEPYSNRGTAKGRLGDNRGAMDDFNKAIELKPTYADAYSNRGVLKSVLKDYKGAIRDLTKAIEIDPKLSNAYYNRGVAKYNLGQRGNACSDFSKAGELGHSGAYELIREYCK